ncbi:diphosphomevalonate decarboxylase [Candidatus Micrarchaeota archaeon]|nr:diphosphomevalonate decarboxylase [Candidatus Micrarchaeota archaeon]MBU1930112.1 diphosphomevalonate decarboxylase [Candidatus Micrarchaeota archaeon]
MKATAQAHSNIALTKYWGKRDKKWMLPNNGSTSMTLDKFYTQTTVEFDEKYGTDEIILNGEKMAADSKEGKEIREHLDLIREMAGISTKTKVSSNNNFPTAAGLASSASGLAALSMAGAKAAGLNLDKKELSILSRRGSGSASRSIEGGFVQWLRGEDSEGKDSFAEQILKPEAWSEFRMIVNIVGTQQKKWKSRAGMAQTVATCPYYPMWKETAQNDSEQMTEFIKQKDFTKVGELAEFNALKMHATMITTQPMILYWQPTTVEIMHNIALWREEGLESYFTMDAGPQVKVMCLAKDESELIKRLHEIKGIQKIEVCKPGPAAKIIEEHLF